MPHEHEGEDVTIVPYGVDIMALTSRREALAGAVAACGGSRLAPNKRIDHGSAGSPVPGSIGVGGAIPRSSAVANVMNSCTSSWRSWGLVEHVSFTGPLSETDKDSVLREAHFILHISQREGWGLNVIEANAMGTPAIVYPVPGLVESTVHEETGLVAGASESSESLAMSSSGALSSATRGLPPLAGERLELCRGPSIGAGASPATSDWLEAQASGRPEEGDRTPAGLT